jgi:hypothetical protein
MSSKFNVAFDSDHGKLSFYEGTDTFIIKQGNDKVIIPLKDWEAFYGAIQIAKLKRRNANVI